MRTLGLNGDAVCAATCLHNNIPPCSVQSRITNCKLCGKRTSALLCFTSFFLNKNCRLRFDKSIVSKSSSVILPKPVRTTFLTENNQPQKLANKKPSKYIPATYVAHIQFHQL